MTTNKQTNKEARASTVYRKKQSMSKFFFLVFRLFFLEHGQFYFKGFMDLALEERNKGDPCA